MNKILLTGATGFIGSHLTPQLVGKSNNVFALVRNKNATIPGCSIIHGDLAIPESLSDLSTRSYGCKLLIHLAALIPQGLEHTDQKDSMNNLNVDSTNNLLMALPKTISHVIVASTIDVYGLPKFLPITECHPTKPVTPYGESKLKVEKLIRNYLKFNGLTGTILRLSQEYGPGEPVIKAIPKFIQSIKSGEVPTLFGDGSELRDYIYVGDVVQSILLASFKKPNGTINIAGGKKVALKDVLEMIIDISGKKIEVEYKKRAKDKIDLFFNLTKANNELKFVPQTNLKNGLKKQFISNL